MTKSLEFYFDFISPYSFLAYKKLKFLTKKKKINIIYKPILLGGLHKLSEITAPAFNKRKMKNMKNDCKIVAKKNDIDFYWNSKFPINSLYLMRGYVAIDKEFKQSYLDICFDAYWKHNVDISTEKNLSEILEKCQINKDNFFKRINDQNIKNELKKFTSLAFQKNIFGAPTFVVNNILFWGQDRLEYALDEYNS